MKDILSFSNKYWTRGHRRVIRARSKYTTNINTSLIQKKMAFFLNLLLIKFYV